MDINKNKLKSYSDEKKNGIKSAATTILQNIAAGGMDIPNIPGASIKPDPRLKMPNLPNKKPSSSNSDENNQNDSENDENNENQDFPQLNQKKLDELADLMKKIRNSANDVIDDNGDEIKHDDNTTGSDSDNNKLDKAKEVLDATKELERDMANDNNAGKNLDKYKKRLQKIADFWKKGNNEEQVQKELENPKATQELKRKIRAQLRKALENKAEYRKYKKVSIKYIENEIIRTLKNEVNTFRNADYRHRSHKTDILGRPVAGRFWDVKENGTPEIGLFFDESGSWTGNKIKYGMEQKITASIIELEKKGKIKLKPIFYFADTTNTDKKQVGKGNSDAPVPFIKDLLAAKELDNVIIMTDDNPATQEKIVVPGYVWLLFYDSVSESFVKNIRGKKGTSIYMIDHSAEDAAEAEEAAAEAEKKKATKKDSK